METSLPSAINWSPNSSKKNIIPSLKKLSLTCFVSAFVFLMGFAPAKIFAAATVTVPTNGQNICNIKAVGGSSPAYTTLNTITVTEGVNSDFGFTSSGSPITLTLTAPNGWQFNTSSSPSYTWSGSNINPTNGVTTSTTTPFTSTSLTIIISGKQTSGTVDAFTIKGLQVQATTTASSTGNITPSSVTPTGSLNGVTTGSAGTNFATLSLQAAVTPSVTIAANPTGTICAGTAVTFTATPTNGGTPTYQWQLNNSNITGATGATYTTTTLANGDQVKVIMTSSVACVSQPTATSNVITMIVNTTAAPTGTSSQSFCASNNPTIVDLTATGTTIKWYAASSGGTALATTTPLINGTHYYASQTASGCESTSKLDVTATVSNPAAPTGTASQSFCASSNPTVAELIATGTIGSTIKWYTASNGGTALTSTTALVDGTHYYASQTVSGCEGTARLNVTATVSNPTAPTGTASQTFCASSNPTVADLAASGSGIKWYAASSGGNALSGTTALVDGNHYYASQTVSGCESTLRFDVTVTISNPAAPIGTASQQFCASNNPTVASLAVTGSSGSTIKWYSAANGGTVLSSTTALVDGNHYYASQTVSGCESASRLDVTATVTSPAAPTGASSQSFCRNPTVADLTATGTGIKWYAASSGGSALSSTTALVGGNHYYASQTVSGCESTSRLDVTAAVTNPAAPNGNASQSFCAGNNPTVADLVATGTGIKWYDASSGGSALANTTPLVDGNHYYASQTVSGCEGTARFDVTVTITQAPVITSQPKDTTVCGTKPFSFVVAATGDGLTYQWYKDGTALSNTRNISGVTTNTLHYTQANFADSNSVFTVKVSGTAPCSAVTSAGATLSVDQKITITRQPLDTTVCTGSDITFTVTATSSDPLTYQWRKNGSNISGATDPTYTITGVSSSYAADYDVVISGTPSNFSCPDVTSTLATLTVNPAVGTPTAITVSSGTEPTCQLTTGTTTTTYSTTASNSTGFNWSISNSAAGSINASSGVMTWADGFSGTVDILVTANGCGTSAQTTKTVTIKANSTIALTSGDATQGVCTNTAISAIKYTIGGGGTGASITGQPDGVTGTYDPTTKVFTISGTPTASGNFSYTVTATGSCNNPSLSGTITVNPNSTISLSSQAGTDAQTKCINTAITNITYSVSGATGATVTGLPSGVSGNYNSGTLTISGTPTESGTFTYTVTSTGGCGTATATGTITVNAALPVSVSISASATTICAGTSVTFTATPTNGGTTPSYQWKVNGTNAGTNSKTFTTSTLANNDKVTVVLTSNVTPCAAGNPATSNTITETVNDAKPVSVSIAASATTICAGTSVTFTATPTNGGTDPSYQWKVNGTNAGTNSKTFTTSTLSNNDKVTVVLTSDIMPCATGNPASSNTITETVNPNLPVSVSIVASNTTICAGTSVTFTATPTNGGTTPSYQWKVNGKNAGINSPTFTTSTLANNDVVTVELTSNATPCATGNPATSNSITMTVNAPSSGGKITPSQTIQCSGSNNGTLTLNNSTGLINWQNSTDLVNWTSTGSTSPTNTYSNLTQTTSYRAVLQSGSCGSAFSDTATVVVNPPFTPTITATPTSPVCSGTPVTLTASGYNSLGVLTVENGDFSTANEPGWSGGSANNNSDGSNLTWGETNNGKTFNGTTYGSNSPSGQKFMVTCGNVSSILSYDDQGAHFSTVGMTSASLEWWQAFKFDAGTVGKVEISTNGGATWSTLIQYNGTSTFAVPDRGFTKASINLKAYLGKPNCNIRFNYSGTLNSSWGIDDIAVTGNYQQLNYNWGSGSTTIATITVVPTKDTTITLSAGSGNCTTTTSQTITVNPLPTAYDVTGGGRYCAGGAGITVGLLNSEAGVNYQLFNGTTAVGTAKAGTGARLSFGFQTAAGTYTVKATNATTSCTQTMNGSATVTIDVLPTVSPITGTTTICVGNTSTLSDATTGGTWSSSNTGVATINTTSGVLTGVAAGTARITYTTAANANGCTNNATATVTVNALPTVAAISGVNSVCVGKTITLSDVTTGGTWSSSDVLVAKVNSTTGVVTGVASGAVTITYTTAPSNGCTNSTTAPVTINLTPAPTITAQGPTASCTGTVTLRSDSATGNQWYKDEVAITLLGTSQDYIATAAGSYTVKVTNTTGCSGTSSQPVVVSFIINSWIAAADSSWNNPLNWCSGNIPTSATDAVIPSNVRFPILSADAEVKNLDIQSGAQISLNGKSLTINGTLTGTNKFVGSTKSGLVLNGTSSSTLNFDNVTDASTNALNDLTINTTGTVTLGSKLYITGTLTSTAGTLNTGDQLTIRSTSITNTARVAPVLGNITGDVTVERFIPGRRSYRFISPSVTTTTTINDNWMEGTVNPGVYSIADPKPGFGTNITGNNPTTNGFDPTRTNNPSLFTFNTSTQQWEAIPNTRGNLKAGDAYRLMVRGSRNTNMAQDDNFPKPTPTILRATGRLETGTVTRTFSGLTANDYIFIGNPYASPVDFNKIVSSATNISPTYYVWDPTFRSRGVYISYNLTDGFPSLDSSRVNNNIQSGQAFFVRSSGNSPSLKFEENYKSTGNTAVFRDPSTRPKLSLQLLLNLNGGKENNADGAVAFFDDNFTTGIGNEDSYKFTNLDENLAINRDGTALSMEGRPSVTANDTIPLLMWQFRQNSYYLRLTGNNFSPEVTAFVKDSYLHKETSVDLSTVTLLPFSISADSASFAKDRFSIVFKAGTALPVTLTNVKAFQKDDGIQVEWTAEAETNIDRYEVEKSINGQQFDKGTAITAKGNNSVTQTYGWLDENSSTGSNFYRIKVIEKSGAVKYSNVVKVNIAAGNGSLTVLPNPIKGNVIAVQLKNMEKGRYSVVLYNTLGQKLYSSTIEHVARSGTYTISLGRIISKGTYTLHLRKGDTIMNERVIVE